VPILIKNFLEAIIPAEHRWKIALFKNWDTIIGSMHDKVIIDKIEDHTLHLGVSHPAWAQELFLLTPVLKQKINSYLGSERIKTIRFKFLDFSSISSAKIMQAERTEKAHAKPHVPYVLTDVEKATLEGITDTELRSDIEKFYARCKQLGQKK
jgi:hypothetical protein